MILIVAAVFLLLGYAVTLRLWPHTDGALSAMERVVYAAIAGAAAWLGSSWILALTGMFTLPVLAGRTFLAVVAAILIGGRALPRRLRSVLAQPRDRTASAVILLALVPLLFWTQFIFWRSALVPPLTHDALGYHLPKAVLIARDAGYEHQPRLNEAIRTLPINYELVLAEAILLDGSDRYTEWPSVLFYWLFLVACTALAGRWWGLRMASSVIVLLLVAATPVALLHSGAHKNDLLVASFMVGGLVAAGRWLSSADTAALVLSVAAFGIAAGAKPQAGLLAICIAPFLAWRLIRTPRRHAVRAFGGAVIAAVLSFTLLGGAVYLINVANEGSLLNARTPPGQENLGLAYGDWTSLWKGPYTLLSAPFSSDPLALRIPWSERPWFWRRYELYFSHLGIIFSLSVLLAPLSAIVFRRAGVWAFEPCAVTLAALAAFALMLPVEFIPHGLYQISLPRYALFILPLALAWGVGPWLARLRQWSRVTIVLVLAAAAWFTVQAVEYGSRDAFVPIDYLMFARQHPGTRVIAFDARRAASVADRAAGPYDRIAVDSGFGTWIHPAFGADLTRPVEFVADGRPESISDDAKYVVIDRAYYIIWRHPEFRDMSQVRQYLGRGPLREEDTRLLDALKRDSRFELLFYNPRLNQAVFRRRS